MKTVKTIDKHIGNISLSNRPGVLKNSKVSPVVLPSKPAPVKNS
jgi:hypothetical protein